jgi:hypothetical protein
VVAPQTKATTDSESARLSAALASKENRIRASFRKMKAAIEQQEAKLLSELHAVAARHTTSAEVKVRSRILQNTMSYSQTVSRCCCCCS